MSAVEPARERIARRLQDAVDRLRRDMDEVEFWTEVLGCLTRPAPDYNDGTPVLDRFTLPAPHPDQSTRLGGMGSSDRADRGGATRSDGVSKGRHSGH